MCWSQNAPRGCFLRAPCSQEAPYVTSDKSKNLAIMVKYFFYFALHIRYTIKNHIICIFYIYLMVLIMMLQAKNENGVRRVALSPICHCYSVVYLYKISEYN